MTAAICRLDPGHLIAEIPGILGFYPNNSVVIVCLDVDGDTVTPCPVMRADMANEDALRGLTSTLDGLFYDYVLAVMVCDDLMAAPNLADYGVGAVATLHVPAVEKGASITLLHVGETAPAALPEHWGLSYVWPVHQSASMQRRFAWARPPRRVHCPGVRPPCTSWVSPTSLNARTG